MAQEWSTRMAGKFFCPHCGALYEAVATGQAHVDRSPECVVCRTDMQPGAQSFTQRPYRLIQRPEAASDF
jgi:hypothetical protein